MKAQCRRATHPKLGLVSSFQIVGQRADPALGQNDGIRLFEDARAKGGRQDALTRPDHQLETQPAFHQLHVAGQCRLRQPERGRRAGKGPGADDFMELKEVAGVYRVHEVSYQKLM